MIVSRRFPELSPRLPTPAQAAFRAAFAGRWGRENVVFLARSAAVDTPPLPTTLSIKLVDNGSAALRIGHRLLRLEPGRCLVLTEGEHYQVRIHSPTPVQCFSLHFRPGLGAEVARTWAEGADAALARGAEPRRAAVPLAAGHLRLPSAELQRALADVRSLALAGEDQAETFEEPFIAVLVALFRGEQAELRRAEALPLARRSARDELARRAARAHDFIISCSAEPITLDHIAEAANLSKYHLIRSFRQLYGTTPHGLLRSRRTEAALALLRQGEAGLGAVAASTGFGSRWALQRALRERTGVAGRQLRRQAQTP